MKKVRWMICLLGLMFLCACSAQNTKKQVSVTEDAEVSIKTQNQVSESLSFDQMQWEKDEDLTFAQQFFIERCGEYALITIVENDRFLLIPENAQIPEHLPEDVKVLQMPLKQVYLASSSVFDLAREANALEQIRFSGTKPEDLCIEEVKAYMEDGRMVYAGKYNKPDYELLCGEGCELAIENTMIYHNPETKEKIESLGIPVLVETSSYESHPYGRMEWIKLYGLLFGHEQEAKTFFEAQVEKLHELEGMEASGKKVAFFYVNANGAVNVRKPGDYVAKMISMAGGEYVLTDIDSEEENALSTMNMQVEDFYLAAKDADVLIYNSTIMGELANVEELIGLNPIFADFKAVKEGRVYCTGKNFFQETTTIGDFVLDVSEALADPDQQEFRQMKKVKR